MDKLERLQYLIAKIDKCRYWHGVELKDKDKVDAEILRLSNSLDKSEYELFVDMIG